MHRWMQDVRAVRGMLRRFIAGQPARVHADSATYIHIVYKFAVLFFVMQVSIKMRRRKWKNKKRRMKKEKEKMREEEKENGKKWKVRKRCKYLARTWSTTYYPVAGSGWSTSVAAFRWKENVAELVGMASALIVSQSIPIKLVYHR